MIRMTLIVIAASMLAGCGGDDPANGDTGKRESPAAPRFELVDVSARSGLDFRLRSGTPEQRTIAEVKSTGVGLFDQDGDGRLDIILTAGSTLERARAGEPGHGTRLYRNRGGLRFEDVTESVGLPATRWACAPVCADYDGDGRVDVYITHLGKNMLLRNTEGGFVDVTDTAGVGDEGWSTSAVFHDLDGDGDLDLYVCNYLAFDVNDPPMHGKDGRTCRWKGFDVMCGPKGLSPQADRCYANDGDGTFTDVTAAWGLDGGAPSFALGVIAGDLDDDGHVEIYVANDGMPNTWWDRDPATGRFEENGYFTGVSCSEGGADQAGMGLDAADLDGDGRAELACTNFSDEVNCLYVSQEAGTWIESSALTGTALAGLPTLGWGVGFRDLDSDGRLDLFVANGHVYPQADRPGTGSSYGQRNLLWRGTGDARFEQVTTAHSGLAPAKVSRGAAFGDLDDDGDVDIVVANLNDTCTVIENATTGHRWAGVRLAASGSRNRDGIGARVSLVSGSRRQVLEVRRQSSFQASHDPRLVLGGAWSEAEVRWPDGKTERFALEQDAYVTLKYGEGR